MYAVRLPLLRWYHITFIDDFSRYIWLYFTSSRSEVISIHKRFVAMVHTSYVCLRVCFMLTMLENVSPRCCVLSLLSEYSCSVSSPGAHAQNGVTGCKQQHLLETARAFMIVACSWLLPLFRLIFGWACLHFTLLTVSSLFSFPLLCRVVFLSSIFFIVLLIIRPFVVVVFAMFFLRIVNAPNWPPGLSSVFS